MKSIKFLQRLIFSAAFVYSCILPVEPSLAEENSPVKTWSKEDIKTSDQSPCRRVFKDPKPPETLCNRCVEFISKNTSLDDRTVLMREFSAIDCRYKDAAFPEPNRTGWSLYADQDTFYPPRNDDRNYTMGLGLSFSGDHFKNGYLATARDTLDQLFSLHTGSNPLERIHTFEYGATAFTPNDLEEEAPIPGDRPYASLVYFSNSKLTAYNDGYAVKSRFVVAALGLGVARTVQRYLHNTVGLSNQDPRGWSNQISDGGEPTALYSVERIGLITEDTTGKRNADLSYTMGANLGYYTDVYAGFDLRVGFNIVAPYYAHNANPLSTVNHVNCVNCNGSDSYLFLSVRGRAVAYNALLQGQFRESKVEIASSDVERLLHEATAGYTQQFFDWCKLTVALNYKSKEFRGPEERSHWFGGLYISKNYD